MKLTIAIGALFATAAFTAPAWAASPEELMTKAKCNKCHTEKTTKKGPSYADIAAKHKGKADPTAQMVEMLKTGGKDDHDKLAASDAELKAVVQSILAAK